MLTEEHEPASLTEARTLLRQMVIHFDTWPNSPYDTDTVIDAARDWLDRHPGPESGHVDHRD